MRYDKAMKYILLLLLTVPTLTRAADGSLQAGLTGIGTFFNTAVIPFMLSIAFFIFVVNTIRFFVIQGDSEDGQKNAKNLAIYSIGAFVFILSFWGIVNIVANGIGLNSDEAPTSDYFDAYYLENLRQAEYCRLNPGSIDCL